MSDDDRDAGESAGAAPGRRDFLGLAITGTAAALGVMAGYPVSRFLEPQEDTSRKSVTMGDAEKFPRGASKMVMLGDRPVMVIRLDDGTFRGYVALCTHLQCVVAYSPDRKRIECPCHHGVYSLEGKNVSGPPPRPLTAVDVSLVNGIVTVTEV